MSRILPHRRVAENAVTRIGYGSPVKTIDFGTGSKPPTVTLEDGRRGAGTCLSCSQPPCLERFAPPGSDSPILSEFPQDPTGALCPTNAIEIEVERGTVSVDHAACIGCGLCLVRCPYGALHTDDSGKARVTVNNSDLVTAGLVDVPIADAGNRIGQLGPLDNPALHSIPTAIEKLNDSAQMRFVANLFTALGVDARVRRKGDTNVRFDGVLGFANGRLGVMEIELSPNAIESPRALVEDVAVLLGRYDVATRSVYPVSVLLYLPNARSEYYQVMEDISKVLELQCRTITVGALLALVWNMGELDNLDDLFLTTSNWLDLTSSVNAILQVNVCEPYPSALITAK